VTQFQLDTALSSVPAPTLIVDLET